MGLNWLTLIPWGTLIENAPRILDASRKLFRRTQETPLRPAEIVINPEHGLDDRVMALEQFADATRHALGEVEARQEEVVRLVDALAEQNAQLTLRLRRQSRVVTVLLVLCFGLTLYALLR
ncbi:hypothetical protein ACTSKR_03155 [Chitinibacteraceae bacterium HSL-7]